jgi:hypothetical protein
MSSDFYGHLVELEPIKGATWRGSAQDPTWRYAAITRGADVLVIDLHTPDTMIARVFEDATTQESLHAVSPDGLTLAQYRVETQTLTLHEDGQRRSMGIASPGGALWFDPTGRYLHVTAMTDGHAGLNVVDTRSLEVCSTLDAIELDTWRTDTTRVMSNGRPELERLADWRDVDLNQDPWDPDSVILNVSYGDSFGGVACLRAKRGHVRQTYTDVLSRSLFDLDGHVWSRVVILPDIGLIASTDLLNPVYLLPWPPVRLDVSPLTECTPRAFVDPEVLDPNGDEVCAQMFRDDPLHDPNPVEVMSVSPEHILVFLDDDRYMIALDPKTLDLLGIVRGHDGGPWYDLTQLGIDRFAADDGDTLRMWKLERT